MLKKKLVVAGALATIAIMALGACTAGSSTGSGGDGESVELTFLTFETPNLGPEFWDAAIERASAEVPGVSIKKLVGTQGVDYLQQLYSSGQAPDIIAGGFASPNGFAQKGQIVAFTEDELKGFVFPTAGAIDGKVYAPAINTQPIPLVYYNKDAFATAGIDAPPASWDDFLAVNEKLKAAGITPILLGGGGQDTWVAELPFEAIVASDILSSDPDWFTKRNAGEVSFSDANFVAAAAKYQDLANNGGLDMAGLSRSYAETEQAFRDQKAAMYPMGSWFGGSADATAPDFEVGVFAWPSADGKAIVPAVTAGGVMVNSKAKDVDLAKKWALAFTLDFTTADELVKADGALISIEGYAPPAGLGPVYTATADLYQKTVADGNVRAAWGQTSGDGSLLAGFGAKMDPALVDLLNGRKTPAEFGEYLDQQWEAASK